MAQQTRGKHANHCYHPLACTQPQAAHHITHTQLSQQAETLVAAALHLEHVCQGVHGPRVSGVDTQRAHAELLGLGVSVGLLQTKRVHAQHTRVVYQVGRPAWHHPRDTVPQVEVVAAVGGVWASREGENT